MELFKLFGTILIDNEKANQSISKTDKQAQTSSNSMSNAFKKVGTALVTAFSISKIKQFGDACIEAYNTQIEAETKLETIMKQRMNSSDKSIKSIKDYASALQKVGVVGDEVQLSGAQQLATFLNTEDALKTLMPAMNNLAVQQNGVNVSFQNMVSIGNLMGKVMQGQTSALTRVGITFTEAQEKVLKYGNEQERASMLAQVITDNVGNMNEVIAKTDDGKIQHAINSFGDLKEKIGSILSPLKAGFYKTLGDISDRLQNNVIPAIQDFAKWLDENKDNIENVAIVLTPLIALFGAYKLVVSAGTIMLGIYNTVTAIGTTVTTALGTAMAFITSPIGLVVVAITGLIAIFSLAWKNSETFRNIVTQAFTKIKETANDVVNNVKSFINSMVDRFNWCKDKATSIFNGVRDAIKNPLETAKKIVKGIVNSIKGFFNFKISWPKIPLPHFSIKPKNWGIGDLLKGKIPSLGIRWYKKAYTEPYAFDQPTVTQVGGKMIGVGDGNGKEVVYGHAQLMEDIRQANRESSQSYEILKILMSVIERMDEIIKSMSRPVVLDTGAVVGGLAPSMDTEFGKIIKHKGRGN